MKKLPFCFGHVNDKKMHILVECLSELRYLGSLRGKKLVKYIHNASKRLIDCLQQIALNILFSHRTGMSIKPKDLKKLKPHKKSLVSLIHSKNHKKKRKILKKGGVVLGLLSVLATVIASLAAAL